jgi:formate dehydrogenase accessory protein FdhE
MRDSWEKRIDRALELAGRDAAARPLLDAYRRLLILQRDCHASLRAHPEPLTGSLDRDLVALRVHVPHILKGVVATGPPRLAEEARQIIAAGNQAIDVLLLTGWHTPSDEHFFARVILQPYANCLVTLGVRPLDRDLPHADNVCPFCGGAPQVSILQNASEAEPGGRQLQCGTCFTTWPFRRLLCARCGEDDERKLGYFRSPAYDHLRVDACDTCRHYLKSVDLSRLGLAVPLVDEVAGAPLDLWAHERGYEKIELNLVGL